jgi:hypothetical protein
VLLLFETLYFNTVLILLACWYSIYNKLKILKKESLVHYTRPPVDGCCVIEKEILLAIALV